ncbi:hypothetical protein M4D68_00715 [Priestia aryabhattai]|uniref:hypothetical protein n=1 Tax=Priestia aryabhattai TaxID=412384 RepID=UPI00203C41BB|nr:hypothetical protein [Priestia aryabhattai]MCM3639668.1 hypothetical protein [Priestia aryabhattai]
MKEIKHTESGQGYTVFSKEDLDKYYADEREKLINFIVQAVYEIEGAEEDAVREKLEDMPYEKLRKEAEWYDYLLGK